MKAKQFLNFSWHLPCERNKLVYNYWDGVNKSTSSRRNSERFSKRLISTWTNDVMVCMIIAHSIRSNLVNPVSVTFCDSAIACHMRRLKHSRNMQICSQFTTILIFWLDVRTLLTKNTLKNDLVCS